jgi:hypothetical protein
MLGKKMGSLLRDGCAQIPNFRYGMGLVEFKGTNWQQNRAGESWLDVRSFARVKIGVNAQNLAEKSTVELDNAANCIVEQSRSEISSTRLFNCGNRLSVRQNQHQTGELT